jgi:hypothetical protein
MREVREEEQVATKKAKQTKKTKKTTDQKPKSAKPSRKYDPRAGEKVAEEMREMKRGELRSGRSGKKVTSRRQAIAIGLSEARREGARVPPPKAKGATRTSGKRTAQSKPRSRSNA